MDRITAADRWERRREVVAAAQSFDLESEDAASQLSVTLQSLAELGSLLVAMKGNVVERSEETPWDAWLASRLGLDSRTADFFIGLHDRLPLDLDETAAATDFPELLDAIEAALGGPADKELEVFEDDFDDPDVDFAFMAGPVS